SRNQLIFWRLKHYNSCISSELSIRLFCITRHAVNLFFKNSKRNVSNTRKYTTLQMIEDELDYTNKSFHNTLRRTFQNSLKHGIELLEYAKLRNTVDVECFNIY